MGEVVLDASAVIAFLEATDALHEPAEAAAVEWRRSEVTRLIPASAYSELLVAPSRAGVIEEWEADFADFDIQVVPVDLEIARVAASVRAQMPALRLSDALV